MKTSLHLAAFLVVLTAPVFLVASPIEDRVRAFELAVKGATVAEPKREPSEPPSAADANTTYLLSLLASLDRIAPQMSNPNMVNNMEMQVGQIVSAYQSSPEVDKAGHDLLKEIHRERQVRVEAAATEMQELLKRLSEITAKATKAAELDETLDGLQRIRGDRYSYYAEDQPLFQRVTAAVEFAKLWQDYLSHLATGQAQLALTDLQSINQNNYGAGLIPRSQLLDRMAAAPPAEGKPEAVATPLEVVEIIRGIKTLDDMGPALQRLAALPQSNPQTARACANLAPLVQAYTSVKASLPEITNLNLAGANDELSIAPPLRSRLLVFILRHYFDSYRGAAPGPDETPQAFVDLVMADAVSREDWPLLRKAVAGQSYLNRNSALNVYATSNIAAGIDQLLAGINQEAASQYSKAVASYQSALKVADITGTAKLIGNKLAAIKRDHPKEYEEGLQTPPAPPVARNFPNQGMIDGTPLRPPAPAPASADRR